jgi:hypothetical protein
MINLAQNIHFLNQIKSFTRISYNVSIINRFGRTFYSDSENVYFNIQKKLKEGQFVDLKLNKNYGKTAVFPSFPVFNQLIIDTL